MTLDKILSQERLEAAERHYHQQDMDVEESNFVPTDFKRQCLCHTEVIGGETYVCRDPSCEIPGHGVHFNWVPQAPATLKAKKADTKRHTSHEVKGDS
jgi:hypothetical protein